MAALWASTDAKEWQAQLDVYEAAIQASSKDRLPDLDRWFDEELPKSLQERNPPHMTQPELVKLVDWKLTRGKWRPRLLDFAKAAPAAQVQEASQAALSLLAKHRDKEPPVAVIKEALAALTVLKGVGPATASAVLEAYDPSIPFTSDEAMLAALQSKDYTVGKVVELVGALRAKAKQLSKDSGRQWTSKEVEKCLYAAAVAAKGGSGKGGSSKGATSGSGKAAAAAGGATQAGKAGKKRKR